MAKEKEQFFNNVATIEITADSGWWLSHMNELPHRVPSLETHHNIYRNMAKTVGYVARYYTPEEKKVYLTELCMNKIKPGCALGLHHLHFVETIIASNLPMYLKLMGTKAFSFFLSDNGVFVIEIAPPAVFSSSSNFRAFKYSVATAYGDMRVYIKRDSMIPHRTNKQAMIESFTPEVTMLAEVVKNSADEEVIKNLTEAFKSLGSLNDVHA